MKSKKKKEVFVKCYRRGLEEMGLYGKNLVGGDPRVKLGDLGVDTIVVCSSATVSPINYSTNW